VDCQASCRATYQYSTLNLGPGVGSGAGSGPLANVSYRYGRVDELNHNLLRVYDADDSLIIEHVYETNTAYPAFNRVVQQKWGPGFVNVEYHDLVLEESTGLNPPPRLFPNAAQIVSRSQFVSRTVCGRMQPKPSFATLVADVRGVPHVHYFDAAWNELRDRNASNSETSDRVYDDAGLLVGVAPSGWTRHLHPERCVGEAGAGDRAPGVRFRR
jgi:hypothetical protein